MPTTSTYLIPTSRSEAIEMFSSDDSLTVFGGGTVLMPEINLDRFDPSGVMFLHCSGLKGVHIAEPSVTVGAATTLEELSRHGPEPLRSAAGLVADPEVRRLATVGGNLSIPYPGDLQAVLMALDAEVTYLGANGESVEPVVTYMDRLRSGERLLALDVNFHLPSQSSYVRLDRPHAHAYTTMAVTVVLSGGEARVTAKGADARCIRLPSVEAALTQGADPETAAANSVQDANPVDDTLASAWYRRRVLPELVRQAIEDALESPASRPATSQENGSEA